MNNQEKNTPDTLPVAREIAEQIHILGDLSGLTTKGIAEKISILDGIYSLSDMENEEEQITNIIYNYACACLENNELHNGRNGQDVADDLYLLWRLRELVR